MIGKVRYEEIEGLTLRIVPEIRDAYDSFGWDPIPSPTDEWVEELISLDNDDERRMGATIVFENLLVPFVMSLFEDEKVHTNRIQEILDWIEFLANHEDHRISGTLINVCFWGDIIDKFSYDIPRIFPYFGPRTRELCINAIDRFHRLDHVDPQVRQFLNEQELSGD